MREEHTGTVTAVRGSVVDARFPSDLPPLRQQLLAGQQSAVVLEVSEHLTIRKKRHAAPSPGWKPG